MAALKALAAQFAGWAAALLLFSGDTTRLGSPLVFAFVQGALAALASRGLRADPWWQAIHALFVPALYGASRLGLPPWLYAAGLGLLLAVFWRTFRGEVPLYLSATATVTALDSLLPADATRLADLGAGTGRVVAALAAARPSAHVDGIEHAPLPWLAARLACAQRANCRLLRRDFWTHPLAHYDAVYAFLSPAVMARLWDKACAEMRPGTRLISNAFPIPGVEAAEVVITDGGRLYCYRVPDRKEGKAA